MPSFSRHEHGRSIEEIAGQPAHEALADEIAEMPGVMEQLAESVERKEWAQNYVQHPLVLSEPPGSVLPVGLYIDGFEYQRKTTGIGFSIINLVTGRRHLSYVANKRRLCRCGCKGWCSYWEVFSWLEWCFYALASGLYPPHRHDGPWRTGEKGSEFAGQPLGFKGALVIIKGDVGLSLFVL